MIFYTLYSTVSCRVVPSNFKLLVNKHSCYVLNKEVVGMDARKVDDKAKHQRAWHDELILVQLEH